LLVTIKTENTQSSASLTTYVLSILKIVCMHSKAKSMHVHTNVLETCVVQICYNNYNSNSIRMFDNIDKEQNYRRFR